MSSLKFGTSGLRGLVVELTDDICASYTWAFLEHIKLSGYLQPDTVLLVGQDLRASSPRMANACIRAAADFCIPIENCGALPTPALAFRSLAVNSPAIMVTGSHIPDDRNGLKFYRPDGEIDKKDEAAILAHLALKLDVLDSASVPIAPVNSTALNAYMARCLGILPPSALKAKRIGVYQHSSVARDFMVDLISGLGGEAFIIARSDVFIPVDTEALRPEDSAIALEACHAHQLDALISTDGDADRPLLADENGVFFRGDMLGLLTAKFVSADVVVTPVTSSTATELSGLFKSVIRTRVGSPYVIEGIEAANRDGAAVVVGFEANGGVLLGSDIKVPGGTLEALPTRDAMLPILAALGLATSAGVPLSALKTMLPARYTASGRLEHIEAARSGPFLDRLRHRSSAIAFLKDAGTVRSFDTIDGSRFVLGNGDVIHYRASGNAPELRCYGESSAQDRALALVAWGLQAAERAL